MNRTTYQAEYHAKNPAASAHRKEAERERMRIAVLYAKLYLLHGRGIPGFVSEKLIEPALTQARKELNTQNVTTHKTIATQTQIV
jgi:hypothetical protein